MSSGNQYGKDDKAQTGKYTIRNEEKEMADIKITSEDIQAVMVEDPNVTLKVQVKALTRALEKAEEEVARLTKEVESNGEVILTRKNTKEK